MPSSFLVLLRLFLRVDNVLVRVRDTRFYHKYGPPAPRLARRTGGGTVWWEVSGLLAGPHECVRRLGAGHVIREHCWLEAPTHEVEARLGGGGGAAEADRRARNALYDPAHIHLLLPKLHTKAFVNEVLTPTNL
jgi:hypothetical protein